MTTSQTWQYIKLESDPLIHASISYWKSYVEYVKYSFDATMTNLAMSHFVIKLKASNFQHAWNFGMRIQRIFILYEIIKFVSP